MSAPSAESRRTRILWGSAIGILVIMLFVAFLRRGSGPDKPEADTQDVQATAAAQLQRQLRATLDGLRPERVNVSSNPQSLVGDLNLWWADYSPSATVPPAEGFAATVKEWLGDEAAASVAAGRFDLRDVAHVRDALLYRAMAESLAAGEGTDRQRVETAFARVVTQIAPLPGYAATVPLGAFEVLLAGRGTADDRVWAFAEVLRQLGIDCVVLEPKSPPGDAPVPAKLVGAIVKGEGVLLFDPQLGLPIPALDDTASPVPSRAVTLADAKQNDALLRQFDVPDGPAYPWTSALLSDLKVQFIVDSAAASPRMLALQTALPAEYSATLFDGPAATADSPSLRDRIVEAGKDGGWSADAVGAWKYPEQQLAAFFAAGAEESPEVHNLLATQFGPQIVRPRTVDGVTIDVLEDSPQPLRVVRILHLSGDVLTALRGYGDIRSAPREYVDDGQLKTIDNTAVQSDAIYWIAVCQGDLQRYDSAVSTLKLWLRDYPAGLWTSPATYALARYEALRGNPQQAVTLLPPAEENQPARLADQFLKRRWQALSAAPATTSTGN